jgi:hypothetical protein
MLLVIFKNHNDDLSKRIGKDITEEGVEKFKRTRQRLADFMIHQYRIKDIALKEINYNFVDNYLWVKSKTKALKENSMNGLLGQRFEEGIKHRPGH